MQEPLSSLLWGSGKSQDRFLVLDLLLGLQGMDGETQASCPNDHTLVSGQGCDHLRVGGGLIQCHPRLGKVRVTREAVPGAGTMTTALLGDERRYWKGSSMPHPTFLPWQSGSGT